MLQIKDIRKEYITGDLRQTALDGVSLNFRDSEFVAILGPSGSGKTTLLNIIGGLDRYDSGDLIIGGISTKQYKDRDWDSYRNHTIGFVFQSYNLIPHQSVLANVELALTISGISRSERRRRAKEALTQVGLGDQIHKRPNQMSGGQMQRVAIARALVNDPDILLADEPTGALDSDTSVQVMELLAEVAKDRLVIMVTHNPELAEAYATRIVRVKDGRIVDDSDPFEVKNAQPARHENMGKSSMSILTSLGLSFNNLRTKKARTFLTAFAGSIGIIGIALILSLSNGVNTYIDDIQKDAMLSYPIQIDSESIDLASLMARAQGSQEKLMETKGTDAVYAENFELERQAALRTTANNLTAFKAYLDREDCDLLQYVGENGIVYSYDTKFDIYTYDPEDVFVNTDGSDLKSVSPFALSNTYFGGSGNAEQMLSGKDGQLVSDAVKDTYELVYGRYPESYNEVMLVLYSNNALSIDKLYELGLLPVSEFDEIQKRMEDNESLDLGQKKVSYAEVCSKTFYLIPQCDLYEEKEDGTFTDISKNKAKVEALAEDALKLKITGVIKPKEDDDTMFFTKPIAYTKALTDWLIDYTDVSPVVKAQRKNADTNILTGLNFESNSKSEKQDAAKTYVAEMTDTEKAALYQVLLMTGQIKEEKTSAEADIANAVGTAFYGGASVQRLALGDEAPASESTDSNAPITDVQIALRVTKLPEHTVMYLGDAIDLTGGTVHETVTLTREDGTSEVIETDQDMTSALYTLDTSLFDSSGTGVYPISLIRTYTDEATGQTYTGNTLLYLLVVPQVQIPQITTTETIDTTETTEATVSTETTATTDTFVSAETGTFPGGLTPEMIQSYLESLAGQAQSATLPSFTMPAVTTPSFSIPDTSGMTPEQLMSLYAALSGGTSPTTPTVTVPTVPSTGTGTAGTQDMASLYAAMMGAQGGALPGSSQDLSALYAQYAQMQGAAGTGTATAPAASQDLSALYAQYAQMQGAQGTGTDLSAFGDMDLSGLTQEQLAAMYAAGQESMAGMNLTAEDYEKLFSMAGKSEAEMVRLMDSYMEHPDGDVLVYIYDQYLASGDLDTNLEAFGVVDPDTPSSISIYADSFEAKDAIAACITDYNEASGEDDKITYTDYTALLMSSITTIVNVISYVLIAFVAVSLVVSSIMIGIITYISVLERTKEIGILRAIGASKHNISQVFNAETFIIGLCSGLLGIGVTLLLLIPGNLVIHALTETDTVNAALPVKDAVVLILLSVVLTLIGGFIPAKKAAKKDPVTALRTE